MKNKATIQLSRRERQIMDILFRRGEATAAEVLQDLPDPPTYSSVRALLAVLEHKKLVRHRRHGRAYLYCATVNRARASRSALKHVVQTFFDGSLEDVVAALVSMRSAEMTDEEFDRLEKLINSVRREEKR